MDGMAEVPSVLEYNDEDVLLGRGNGVNAHVGNERFRELADQRSREFLSAQPFRRTEIAHALVARVHATKGRFLRRVTYKHDGEYKTGWEVVDNDVAVTKAKQILRDRMNALKRAARNDSTTDRPSKKAKSNNLPRLNLDTASPGGLNAGVVTGSDLYNDTGSQPNLIASTTTGRIHSDSVDSQATLASVLLHSHLQNSVASLVQPQFSNPTAAAIPSVALASPEYSAVGPTPAPRLSRAELIQLELLIRQRQAEERAILEALTRRR